MNPTGSEKELSFAGFRSVIRAIYEDAKVPSISFTGGEPLLVKDIGKIIEHAKSRGIYVGLNSNGMLVDKRVNDISGLDLLMISLDGDRITHERNRGKNTFEAAIEALKIGRQHNIRIAATCVLTQNNLSSVDYLLRLTKEMSFTIYFQPVSRIPLGADELRAPDKITYLRTIKKLIKEKKENKYIGNSFTGLNYLLNWPDYRHIPCTAGKIYCAIDPQGNLYACSNLRNLTKGIGILEKGFRHAFKTMERRSCRNCWCASQVEMNYLSSFEPEVLINTFLKQF